MNETSMGYFLLVDFFVTSASAVIPIAVVLLLGLWWIGFDCTPGAHQATLSASSQLAWGDKIRWKTIHWSR